MVETIARLEARRLSLQGELDAKKTALERNKLGQFATPPALAREILEFGRRLVGMRKKLHFLDPAIGTGSFYSAVCAVTPASKLGRCLGFEIDPHYAEPAKTLWQDSPLDLRVEDFTRARPPEKDRGRANLVICNPPYVRHHHLSAEQKEYLQRTVSERLGIRINGLAGLYCYFLLLADAWLQPGGVAGWLIPSEWMDVNYGAQVKEYLMSRVRLIRVHRFDPNDMQFDDALVSSTVVWFRKESPTASDTVEFSYGGSLGEPVRRVSVARATVENTRKWTQLCPRSDEKVAEYANRVANQVDESGPRLADFFTIKRGIATGANAFFVLSPEEIAARDLPMGYFRPILPSPRHLETDEIRPLADGNPDIERRRFLLSIDDHPMIIRAWHPRIWRYLEEGVEEGIHERYLCRRRTPWYAQEERPPAPILCTYMGRETDKSARPFRFILNHSRATAANVYLMLYPRAALTRLLARDRQLLRRLWTALSSMPIDVLLDEGRVYGGGLHKLEPRELANVSLSSLGMDGFGEITPKRDRNLELFPREPT